MPGGGAKIRPGRSASTPIRSPAARALGQLDLSFVRLPQPTAFYQSFTGRFSRLVVDLSSTLRLLREEVPRLLRGSGRRRRRRLRPGDDEPARPRAELRRDLPRRTSLRHARRRRLHRDDGRARARPRARRSGRRRAAPLRGLRSHLRQRRRPDAPERVRRRFDRRERARRRTRRLLRPLGRLDRRSGLALPAPARRAPAAARGALSARVGSSRVQSDAPGIDCPTVCSIAWDGGERVTLEAIPGDDRRVVRWTGACTGTSSTCALTMDRPQSAGVVFGPLTYAGRVVVAGRGRVTSAALGFACARSCTGRFDAEQHSRLPRSARSGLGLRGLDGRLPRQERVPPPLRPEPRDPRRLQAALTASDTLSLARRGVRAAEGARLEIAYASKGVSRVQIPPSPLLAQGRNLREQIPTAQRPLKGRFAPGSLTSPGLLARRGALGILS